MLKNYSLITAALLTFSVGVTAQTTAEIAGKYEMECTPLIKGLSEEFTDIYSVTLTADANDPSLIYMDGFLGSACNADLDEELFVGKYDAEKHTITFTPKDGQTALYMGTNDWYVSTLPEFTVSVEGEGDDIMISSTAALNFNGTGLYGDEEGNIPTYTGMLEDFIMTKVATYPISKEDLVGTYKFDYTSLDNATGGFVDGTSTFTISAEGDQLVLSGLLGSKRALPLIYGETEFSIDPIQEEGESGAFMLANTMDFGAVTFTFTPEGIKVGTSFALIDGELMVTVVDGLATKDVQDGIDTVENSETKKETAIYTLQGIRVNTSSTNNLPKGLYIVNGKKTLVK